MTLGQQLVLSDPDAVLQRADLVRVFDVAKALSTYDPKRMTDADETSIIDALATLNGGLKLITAEEKRLVDPFNKGIAQIREKFRQPKWSIDQALTAGKRLLLAYRAEKDRRAREAREAEERVTRELAAAAQATAEPGLDIPASAELVEPPAIPLALPPQNKVVGGVGTATGTKRLTVKLVDVALVAQHFPHLLRLDESAAKLEYRAAAARTPSPTLPGLVFEYVQDIAIGGR